MKYIYLMAFIILSHNLQAMDPRPWCKSKQGGTVKYNLADLACFIDMRDIEKVNEILLYFYNTEGLDKINDAGGTGLSPLHRALIAPFIDDLIILEIFIHNIDPNVKASKYVKITTHKHEKIQICLGWNAAHIAVRFFAENHILDILKEKGTDFEAKDARGLTPLDLSRKCGNARAERFILSLTEKGKAPLETY